MVVEHTFITTLNGAEALRLASEFLGRGGFEAQAAPAFQVQALPVAAVHQPQQQPEWNSLDMRRGKKNPARAKSISQLPQAVRVDFDRGRVVVAASITASPVWGGRQYMQIGFGLDKTSGESPKKMRTHAELLTAIANGLELLLSRGVDASQAELEWKRVEDHIALLARRRRRNHWIAVTLLVLFFVGLIAFIAFMANMR